MALRNLVGRLERFDKAEEDTFEAGPKLTMPAPRTVAPATSIDASTQLTGKLRCKETIRIDGRVKGEVRCDKTVILGEAASVEATIEADSVVIGGELKGDIRAKRKITLERTARVTGDLCTPGIVIEEGAKLAGRIVIGADEQAAAAKQPAASRRQAASAPSPTPSQGVTQPAS